MQRVMWAPLGTGGEVLHAIAVVHKGGDTATSLCGYDEPLATSQPGMKPCSNCQETLKALVDSMPPNATV